MRFFAETKRTTHNTLIRHVSSSGFVFPAITCAISSRCGGRRDAPRATVRLQEYESPRVLQPALQKAADAFGEKDEVHFGQVNGYKEKAIQTRYEVKGHPSFKVTLLADSLSFSPRSALGQRLPPPPPSARICSVVRQRQHGCVALLLRPLHGWIRRYAHQNGELALLSHACPPAGAAVHSRAFFFDAPLLNRRADQRANPQEPRRALVKKTYALIRPWVKGPAECLPQEPSAALPGPAAQRAMHTRHVRSRSMHRDGDPRDPTPSPRRARSVVRRVRRAAAFPAHCAFSTGTRRTRLPRRICCPARCAREGGTSARMSARRAGRSRRRACACRRSR